MAVAHLKYSPTTSTHGKFVQSAVTGLKDGKQRLKDIVATLAMMIDGDGSDAAHFPYMATALGTDVGTAKAIWDELNSAKFKLTTNAAVTDVDAALDQLASKLLV